jgi:hypothetical protein
LILGDLITELRENILHDRSDQVGGPSDYLWSDDTLTRYINQAYFRFATEALCLRDNVTPQYTQFTSAANVEQYVLDPAVLAVISVQMTGDRGDLIRAGHADFNMGFRPDHYFFDPNALAVLPPGKPQAFSTDEGMAETDDGALSAVTLRLFPIPSTDYAPVVGKMRVIRLPSGPLKDPNDVPELPERHHLEMLDWAAYLALRIVDHDLGDTGRAQEFKASFEDSAHKARLLSMRKMFAPLQHGFGRNGWSWGDNNGL